MKKNIVGHMMAPKESKMSRFKRLDLLPRFLCLLLALIIWLLIVNVENSSQDASYDSGDAISNLFE